jgi:hypothetical protein
MNSRSVLTAVVVLLIAMSPPWHARGDPPIETAYKTGEWEFAGLDWVSKGKIIQIRGEALRRDDFEFYVYEGPDRKAGIAITCSIPGVESLVRGESPVIDMVFIKSRLPDLLVLAFAPANARVVQPSFIAEYERNRSEVNAATINQLRQEKYSPTASAQDGRWHVDFYVLSYDGSLSRFHAEGQSVPFLLQSLNVTVTAKEGTFVPLRMIK